MALPEHERSERRLRIEHAQIMKLEDLERAAKLGSESRSLLNLRAIFAE